jgi:fatty-acyl-CoA synthase
MMRDPKAPTVPGLVRGFSEVMPDATCITQGPRRLSWREFYGRAARFANVLAARGIGLHRERPELENWESGQDHVALLLRNRPEYLEAMVGSFIARAVSFNVNYRYTVDELAEVFADARPRVVVADSEFAEAAADAIERSGVRAEILQVPDASGAPLVQGAHWYADDVDTASDAVPRDDWSPDDLYMLFTGGTTGHPKGVLWRQGDALVSAFGVSHRDGSGFATVDEAIERAQQKRPGPVVLPCPPLIHGAAQWATLANMFLGGAVVFAEDSLHFSPATVLDTVDREGVNVVLVVGDAFGRQLADALEDDPRTFPSWQVLLNGGAALSAPVRDRFQHRLPTARIVDSMGASETGRQASRSFRGSADESQLKALSGTVVLTQDRTAFETPGSGAVGWLARRGAIPLGYLNDAEKTAGTFIEIDGERFVVPGDRARLSADGTIEFLGRDSTTINTGGEKVFAEEVEDVISAHALVTDCLVLGRPSEKWGQEVVALVVAPDAIDAEEIRSHIREHLAGYKVPRAIQFVDRIPRTDAGKADRRAAQELWRAGDPDAEAATSR